MKNVNILLNLFSQEKNDILKSENHLKIWLYVIFLFGFNEKYGYNEIDNTLHF